MTARGECFLEKLERTAVAGLSVFGASWRRMTDGDAARDRFIAYMVEVYHYLRFSCPFMARTSTRLGSAESGLAAYLDRHIVEERDHDQWMLDDLGRLGIDRAAVTAATPLRETVALVGSQLFTIEHGTPVAYFGYIYAMERGAPSTASVDGWGEAFQIPRSALSTFYEHASLDPGGHVADLRTVLGTFVTESAPQRAVLENLGRTLIGACDLVLALAMEDSARLRSRVKALGAPI